MASGKPKDGKKGKGENMDSSKSKNTKTGPMTERNTKNEGSMDEKTSSGKVNGVRK